MMNFAATAVPLSATISARIDTTSAGDGRLDCMVEKAPCLVDSVRPPRYPVVAIRRAGCRVGSYRFPTSAMNLVARVGLYRHDRSQGDSQDGVVPRRLCHQPRRDPRVDVRMVRRGLG